MNWMTRHRIIALTAVLASAVVVSTISWTKTQAASVQAGLVVKVALPQVPPVSDRYPDIYDKDGCLLSSEGRKCGPQNSRVKDQGDQSPGKWRALQGFSGPLYATEVSDDGVKVLTESISSPNNGSWKAMGLVRNNLTREVGGIEVHASLYSADGTLLARAKASVPVDRIRPGEPAPFSVASDVDSSMVTRVEWDAIAAAPGPSSRSVLIKTYWEQPYGEPDGPDSVAPYILATGMTNLGPSIHDAVLVVGWLDDAGKLVWLETSPMVKGKQQTIPRDGGALFEKVRVSDPGVSRRLHSLSKIMWVVAK